QATVLGTADPSFTGRLRVVATRADAERWLAYLYLAAGVLGLLNTVLPGYGGFNVPGLLGLSAGAFVLAGALLRSRGRCPTWALHGLLATGTACVAAAIHFTQGVPNAGALFYLWVALYAFYFFPSRIAWVHVALIGVSYATAIALRPPDFSPIAHWTTTVLTMATAGAFVGMLTSRLDQSLDRLTTLADTDALTGVGNRRAWAARADLEIARAERSKQSLAVAVLDLDHFKQFNDQHGHAAGDRLLVECAAAWHHTLRDIDFVARLGGDEFAVLLPGCGSGAAGGIVERLQRVVPPGAQCSVGIAQWRRGEPIEATFTRADRALYEAKRGGRGRLVVLGGSGEDPEPGA
ncbi:MAG TPA: GGDEF domain-containing protein, partial [Solirubrobacteraceae bacterium]|nr:GGDEF domain-containing protein [Solirubrobacteraceae bacterium]